MPADTDQGKEGLSRRRFLKLAGGSVGGALVLAACGTDDPAPAPQTTAAAAPTTAAPGTTAAATTETTAAATAETTATTAAAGTTATTAAAVADTTTTTRAIERGLPAIEGHIVITDPARYPTSFNESPEMAARVAAGELPPVEERVPRNPLVVEPVHEIGTYGGRELRRGYISTVNDRQNANRFNGGPDNLIYWDYEHRGLVPNIAAGFEVNADATVMTIFLREGMKWSDGAPFTADDIVWWRNHMSLNSEVTAPPGQLRVGGEHMVVEKVDDYTVTLTAVAPYPLLPEIMAGWGSINGQTITGQFGLGGFAPSHYLQQFHADFNPDAEALAQDAGQDSWAAYLKNRNTWQFNPELPTVTPWVMTRPINDPPWEFEANPYSIWVDTAGNQLPYIHKISMAGAEDREVLVLNAVAGEYDFQDRHLQVASLPVLLENQERSGYTIHRTPGVESDFGVRINLAYDADPVIGELIRTTDFRRALSMGVDRDEINEAIFLGTSQPTSPAPSPESVYYPGPEWTTKWATLDVDAANGLLDGIGLTEKDGEGFRLRPDGSGDRIVLVYEAPASFADFPAAGQLIREHWREIGIDLSAGPAVTGGLLVEKAEANEIMLSGHVVSSPDPFRQQDLIMPTRTNNYPGLIGIPYAKWRATDGADGVEPPDQLMIKEGWALLDAGLVETDEAERIRIAQEIYKLHVDQVWSIGVVGFGLAIYGMYLANDNLGNVPARILNTLDQRAPSNALPPAFYWKA